MLRVLQRFNDEHIDAIPFKGPALGIRLYNKLSFRAFGDLDILIHRKDFYRVKEILITMGYQPFRSFSEKKEAKFLDTQMGYEFVRHDERCVIEIHWSLVSRIHAFQIPDAQLWSNTEPIELQNKYVPGLDDIHLFIYLCAHGTKSFWARLRWITDIAELASIKSKEPDANAWWALMIEHASRYNSARMVYLGIYLAHKLLNAPIPQPLIEQASNDQKVLFLYQRVVQALFVPPDKKKEVLKPISFHLQMKRAIPGQTTVYRTRFKTLASTQ